LLCKANFLRAYLEDIRTFVAEQNEEASALADSIKKIFAEMQEENRAA
jgi:hypothetical protein